MSESFLDVRRAVPLMLASAMCGLAVLAATPPSTVNYQGVLRDASGQPLAQPSADMVFRFFDGEPPGSGNEILVDSHTTASGEPVDLTGGLFSVKLGGGAVMDGAGPGTYTSLAEVFRDYSNVWLEVQVAAEILTPRVQVVSVPYAHTAGNAGNADNLDGRGPSYYLNTGVLEQVKLGSMMTGTLPGVEYGLRAKGAAFGAWGEGGAVGVWGTGNTAGGMFTNNSVFSRAHLAHEGDGIQATGCYPSGMGGYFWDDCYSGVAELGIGDTGVVGFGSYEAGHFNSAGGRGLATYGTSSAGFFANHDNQSYGWLAYPVDGGLGIISFGRWAGGRFWDLDGTYAEVAVNGFNIFGNGIYSSAQNDPFEKDRVIAYAAPGGDEVATYTRGTARLVDGVARVPLGQTFAWVTNPDIGLTAYVTPVGGWTDLYVDSKSPSEIVVRSRDAEADDVTFDYIVYGLRIGFEEAGIVQQKRLQSFIPSTRDLVKAYEDHPELRAFNALERFKAMRVAAGETKELDLSASTALRDAIGAYNPEVHGSVSELSGLEHPTPTISAGAGLSGEPAIPAESPGKVVPLAEAVSRSAVEPASRVETAVAASGPAAARDGLTSSVRALLPRVRVSEPVQVGEVLVADSDEPGATHLGAVPADPTVVGIVAADDPAILAEAGEVPLALAGAIVPCKVDAGYGAIRVGDLLTVSPTRGHAMRSADSQPGTIVAKALEPLDTGTGLIRVLVMPR